LKRARQLLEQQFISQSEVDAAEARHQRVLASIEAARFGVREAEVAVENTRILAPFNGTVLKKNADVGEIVAPLAGAASSRAAVVTIADLSSLEIEADVSEANIARVSPGQTCVVTLDAYPERAYEGAVSKIVPTVDRAKATVLVKIRFKSYDSSVLPEMSVKIAFLSRDSGGAANLSKSVLTVPEAAVAARNGRSVVYQVKDNRAVEVLVVPGQRLGNLVEIRQGLKAGEKVIAAVSDKIRHGSKIAVKSR
jgi:RND family efflux transporter MFP subunit